MALKVKKYVVVDPETHKLISIESATTGRDMYELVRDAWDAYKHPERVTVMGQTSSPEKGGSQKIQIDYNSSVPTASETALLQAIKTAANVLNAALEGHQHEQPGLTDATVGKGHIAEKVRSTLGRRKNTGKRASGL